ncbi:hypothetical protein E2562_013341 [Oryza meyeriana var. granulata]|uniref:CCHC-type domain-containing protein n=1 Tax=Oryza meyeriana var. granulata TaxID=110450 RepID=A0A6G1CEQ6_9ORYZ|nr:hypothetical protein E2562_013341 [Oryza meyeriana var. granulata]
MLDDLEFDDGGARLLEQIAHQEALNAATRFPLRDEDLADTLCKKLPEDVGIAAIPRSKVAGATMHDVWHVARIMEALRISREDQEVHGRCGNCGEPGHDTGDCLG